MSENTLFAIIVCAIVTFGIIAISSTESEHEKIMNKIEEKKALLELEDEVEYRRLTKWADSMIMEINKR